MLATGIRSAAWRPSSYEATVQINLSAGYPLGAFIPLGVGHELTGQDSAWLFQPYLALMAAFMSLVFYELAAPVIRDHRLRAAAIFIAAQPALLIGYASGAGSEVATALLVAILPPVRSNWPGIRKPRSAVVVPILSGAALIGVMGAGGCPGWRRSSGGRRAHGRDDLAAAPGGEEVSGLLPDDAGRRPDRPGRDRRDRLADRFRRWPALSPNQGPLTSAEEMGNPDPPAQPRAVPGTVAGGRFPGRAGFQPGQPAHDAARARHGGRCGLWPGRGGQPAAWGLLLLTLAPDRLVSGLAGRLSLGAGQGPRHRVGFFPGSSRWPASDTRLEPARRLREGEVEGGSRPFASVPAVWLGSRSARSFLIVPAGARFERAGYHETWLAPKAQLAELSKSGRSSG